jgi:SAM-dependent methyltransferase
MTVSAWEAVAAATAIGAGTAVLDLGCGTGAYVAVCKWSRPEHNELFALLQAVTGSPVPPAGRPDTIAQAARRAGLEVQTAADVPVALEIAGDAALEAAVSAAVSAKLDRREVLAAAARFRRPDGAYRFSNRLRYFVATA